MPHSRTPCKETSTSAYGWATMNINKSQTSKIKVVIQEGCTTTTTTTTATTSTATTSNTTTTTTTTKNNNNSINNTSIK